MRSFLTAGFGLVALAFAMIGVCENPHSIATLDVQTWRPWMVSAVCLLVVVLLQTLQRRRVCSWCNTAQNFGQIRPTSHGMCETCYDTHAPSFHEPSIVRRNR